MAGKKFQLTPSPLISCMARLSKYGQLVLTFAWVVMLSLMTPASATLNPMRFDPSFLEGIDTIIIFHDFEPGVTLLPLHEENEYVRAFAPVDEKKLFLPAFKEVEKIFKEVPWITVKSGHGAFQKLRLEPNVIEFQFVSSTRIEEIDGKPIKLSSLSLQIRKLSPGALSVGDALNKRFVSVVPLKPVTYSFVVQNSKEELASKIAEGVAYLTSFMPSYFSCAKDKVTCGQVQPPAYRRK